MLAYSAHAFGEGNKRTAWLATRAFLFINGFEISVTDETEIIDFVKSIACGEQSKNKIANWLRKNIKKGQVQ